MCKRFIGFSLCLYGVQLLNASVAPIYFGQSAVADWGLLTCISGSLCRVSFFLREQSDEFLRTVIQVRLASALPEFVITCSEYSGQGVTGYMREVIMSFRLLRARFSLEYLSNITKRKLYKDLIDVMLPTPIYRAVNCGGPGNDVLKRVRRMPVNSTVKSFFFKLHTNCLPVKTWLHEKGIYVPWSVDCSLCKKPETIDHAFIDCWDAVFHWDILQRTLKKELPITPIGIRFLPTDNSDGTPCDMFMLLSLHSLCKTRMAVRHVDVKVCSVRENFIASIANLRAQYRAQADPPEWVAILDELVNFKHF